jgi:hypothetical protein
VPPESIPQHFFVDMLVVPCRHDVFGDDALPFRERITREREARRAHGLDSVLVGFIFLSPDRELRIAAQVLAMYVAALVQEDRERVPILDRRACDRPLVLGTSFYCGEPAPFPKDVSGGPVTLHDHFKLFPH